MSLDKEKSIDAIKNGETFLGIELGSTRIKAVLINANHVSIASGSKEWKNQLTEGVWTYKLDEIWDGLRSCYASLTSDVREKYDVELTTVKAMGISAMMHGYMVFGKDEKQLVPFRTWRNTITGDASKELTELFGYNIPQRWSIAHLYQACLNIEDHVTDISYLTTLAGYIHWRLTGEKVIGVGDASGMFPIDFVTGSYDARMVEKFEALIAKKGYPWKFSDIMPRILSAGETAGLLTEAGAKLLDPTGKLSRGIPLCPPEGDAGTGMVATNSVRKHTGNVSAGTSVFAMIVIDKNLAKVHPEIDLVTTPDGKPVAMVHCNNCTGDIDAWVNLFGEFAEAADLTMKRSELYALLYNKALGGEDSCGGLLSFNYYSGEPVTGFDEGFPLFVRQPSSKLTLANFMRVHFYSACATLRIGLDILFDQENVRVDSISGHGGFFKSGDIGERIMAAALNTPVSVMDTAGEGGPWGMAVLAAYMQMHKENDTLESYLENSVFCESKGKTVFPEARDVAGFELYLENYRKGLSIEKAAVTCFSTL